MTRMGLVRPVLIVAVTVAALLAAVWLGQRRLVYFPDRSTPVPGDWGTEAVLLTSDGLRLAGRLVPPARGDRRTAVLVAPGNAGHRGHRKPLAAGLAEAGFTVLLFDYRGYGGNPGSPSEAGLAHDARAALAYLRGAGFSLDRVIYFGESLGAAVITELATEHRPAGLVLRSPFVDLASTGREHYPWLPVGLLLRDRYPLAEHLAALPVPTTVIFGSADSVIPAAQSRTVADRAAGPVRVIEVEGADHNDAVLSHGAVLVGAVADLAKGIGR